KYESARHRRKLALSKAKPRCLRQPLWERVELPSAKMKVAGGRCGLRRGSARGYGVVGSPTRASATGGPILSRAGQDATTTLPGEPARSTQPSAAIQGRIRACSDGRTGRKSRPYVRPLAVEVRGRGGS